MNVEKVCSITWYAFNYFDFSSFWNEIDFRCVSKRLTKKWRTIYIDHSDLQQHSECPTFNKHRSAAFQIRYQVLSVLAPFFWRPFWKVWNVYTWGCIDLLVLFHCLKTLLWRIKFSSPSLLLKQFCWHTSGENIDTYGGTNQQQQVSHICCLTVCVKLKIPG